MAHTQLGFSLFTGDLPHRQVLTCRKDQVLCEDAVVRMRNGQVGTHHLISLLPACKGLRFPRYWSCSCPLALRSSCGGVLYVKREWSRGCLYLESQRTFCQEACCNSAEKTNHGFLNGCVNYMSVTVPCQAPHQGRMMNTCF